MLRSRSRALAAALSCAVATLALVQPASADGTAATGGPQAFTGLDGLLYQPAPLVVTGADGEEFMGSDFDSACGGSQRLKAKLRGLERLARTIRASGRRVVFTVAPNKALVIDAEPSAELLPHGECAARGLAAQKELFDRFSGPGYLPLRQPLVATRGQTYFRTDPHWTTVGGATYVKQLARTLDPRLERRQHFRRTTYTMLGIFHYWYSNPETETAESLVPAGPVRTVTDPDSAAPFSGLPDIVFDHSWTTTPARKAWGGRSLLIGDSFTLYALENLRPLFAHGRFLWSGHVPEADLVQGIEDADTVVIEVVSYLLPGSPLVTKELRRAVAGALR